MLSMHDLSILCAAKNFTFIGSLGFTCVQCHIFLQKDDQTANLCRLNIVSMHQYNVEAHNYINIVGAVYEVFVS